MNRFGWADVGRTLIGIAVALVATAGTTEVMLRLLRPRSDLLRTLLYSPTDPVPYDGLDTLQELLQAAPFHAKPFDVWFGYKLNSLGFRTPEYSRAKPPGTYRILAVGDSFTSDSGGVPADQLWHQLVGVDLARRIGEPVEVINLGVPGVGPRFTLRLFDIEGRHLSADLVLFGLFIGNDLTDERSGSALTAGLNQRSLAWRFLKHVVLLARNAPELVAEYRRQGTGRNSEGRGPGGYPMPGYVYNPDTGFVSEAEFLRIERRRSEIFAVGRQRQVAGWIADVAGTVSDLDRGVRAAGGKLIVLVIPDVVQVDDTVQRAVSSMGRPPGGRYDFGWVQPEIMRRLTAAGVTALDVLPSFRAAPKTPRLYRLHETHWSAAGNALAAEQLSTFLAEQSATGSRRSRAGLARHRSQLNACPVSRPLRRRTPHREYSPQ